MRHHLALCVDCLGAYRAEWPGLADRQIRQASLRARRCDRCDSRRVVVLVPNLERSGR
jgi:hypothetical protein